MRFHLFIFIIFSFLTFPGCDRPLSVLDMNSEAGIIGRWKQTAEMYSIGDGTVHTRVLDDTVYRYLQFNADNAIETNMEAFLPYKEYRLEKDSSVLFISKNQSLSKYRYIKAGDSLDIYLQCIEACGVRLKRER